MVNVLQKSKSLLRGILDVLLPPVCYVCGKSCSSKYGLCPDCVGRIINIPSPYCPKCGRHIRPTESVCAECNVKKSYLERAWSSCYYKDTIKECIHLFKFSGYIGLVDIFANIMSKFIKINKIDGLADLLVPVPAYSTKKRERSYNHAEILAKAITKNFAIPLDVRNLKKIKWTSPQSELDKDERLKNVKNTFLVVDRRVFCGRNILIIDDVYTTGATVNECAKILLDAGASKVYSLSLAR